MWFLTINSLKSTSSPINLIFEHVQYVIGPIAIFQYWWQFSILMQLTCLMWQTRHPTISWIDVEDWLSCIQDNASDMLFNRLKETMCIACIVMGDSIDNPRLVCVGLLAYTFDDQAIAINTLQRLVRKLLEEANDIMNNQVGEHKLKQSQCFYFKYSFNFKCCCM